MQGLNERLSWIKLQTNIKKMNLDIWAKHILIKYMERWIPFSVRLTLQPNYCPNELVWCVCENVYKSPDGNKRKKNWYLRDWCTTSMWNSKPKAETQNGNTIALAISHSTNGEGRRGDVTWVISRLNYIYICVASSFTNY